MCDRNAIGNAAGDGFTKPWTGEGNKVEIPASLLGRIIKALTTPGNGDGPAILEDARKLMPKLTMKDLEDGARFRFGNDSPVVIRIKVPDGYVLYTPNSAGKLYYYTIGRMDASVWNNEVDPL